MAEDLRWLSVDGAGSSSVHGGGGSSITKQTYFIMCALNTTLVSIHVGHGQWNDCFALPLDFVVNLIKIEIDLQPPVKAREIE